ncbi:putative DENN (AEX-3) domain containing protein [Leishmania shawi]|uniref:DENN (AEX-3) domain containing protein n=1 Tax=Leishmania shawi TaxID=5680 RepID=A0AAW3CB98_9TRYP
MLGGTGGGVGSSRSTDGGDGVPLITRLLLLRATVRFSLSPSTLSTSSDGETALMMPELRIVSHYVRGSSLRPVTSTPKEEAQFLEAHPSLHGLLLSLAAGRLAQRVKLRRLQTSVVRTSVKLTQRAALTSLAEAAPASRSGGSSRAVDYNQLQGVVAAATASFAEDVAWYSTVTPHSAQLNPWCLLPISAAGCYLTVPSPPFVHWCKLQAAHCCVEAGAASSVKPGVHGGPMRYNDIVHYASSAPSPSSNTHSYTGVTAVQSTGVGEDGGYVHGYAFILEGDVFSGSGVDEAAAAATAAAAAATESQRSEALSRDSGDEEASVLLWCVLSDAPVFNFMCALTHAAVGAMSCVAQRLYHERAMFTESSSASPLLSNGVYTALLDDAIQEEVVRPLAKELLTFGSASSRTLPGDTFTVQLALTRSSSGGAIASHRLAASISNQLTFRRPLDLLYAHADVPLSLLLLSFNEDALRVLQSLLLQEARVVVLGSTPQHASACVVSLLALLGPLTWVSPLIPYLPPHLAAVTGLLQTLLRPPFEQPGQRAPSGKSLSPAPSSQWKESSGFLLGSTAAIQPYLILLSSSPKVEAGMSASDYNRSDKRALRLWIADARTGCVGVCPEDPVMRFSQADSLPSTDPSDGSATPAPASRGAVNAWASRAHVNLREIASHNYKPDENQSVSALYSAVRSNLRAVAESNVMSAAPLDLLPAFSDDLRDQLRRLVSVDKRRLFRHSLEAVAQHMHARLEALESLAARLARGLRQAITATDLCCNVSVASTLNDSFENRSNCSDTEGSSGGLTAAHAGDDDGNDTSPLRAITEALAKSYSHSFAGDAAPSATSFAAAHTPQFPVLSPSELWQVQAGVFGYVVERFTGAYRRGLSTTTLGNGAGGCEQRRTTAMESSVFLVPGMNQNYTLAERVAQTHIFKQFECAVLAAEQVGLRRVFSGVPHTRVGEGGHPLLTNVRSLAFFALLCSRARLHYAELYPDMASVDAVGLVYTSVVTRWFSNRRGPSSSVSVPGAIRFLAGGHNDSNNDPVEVADADATHAPHGGSGPGVHSSGSSRGGGGGGGSGSLRGFFSKVAKVVKHGYSTSGRAREPQSVYLPAAIACLHNFSVPLFSQLSKTPQSFATTPYSENTSMKSSSSSEAGGAPGSGGGRRYHRRHHNAHAFLTTCKPPPERIKWARQQQQQQHIALNMDFTLPNGANVGRAAGLGGGSGSTYGSGPGIESARVDLITRTGGDSIGGPDKAGSSAAAPCRDGGLQAMAGVSLDICRALPLDIVHEFDAYQPLLRPTAPGSAECSSASNGEDALAARSAAAFMRVGYLCPSSMNMWREGEVRTMRAALHQSPPRPAKPPVSSASPSASSTRSRLPLHPGAENPAETSIPPDSLCLFPAPPQSTAPLPTTTTALSMETSTSSVWCAFTSGAPQDYPSADPAASGGHSGGDAQQHQVAPVRASVAASSPLSHAAAPLPAPSASDSASLRSSTSHHREVENLWCVQLPLVLENGLPAPLQGAATQRMMTQTADSGGGGTWSSGAPLAPPTMPDEVKAASPCRAFALTPIPAVAVAPAPRSVMDDLFADMPTSSTVNAATAGKDDKQQLMAASRLHALDNFF